MDDPTTQPLTQDDLDTLASASPNLVSSMGSLTDAQIAALKALVAYIKSHPGL